MGKMLAGGCFALLMLFMTAMPVFGMDGPNDSLEQGYELTLTPVANVIDDGLQSDDPGNEMNFINNFENYAAGNISGFAQQIRLTMAPCMACPGVDAPYKGMALIPPRYPLKKPRLD